MDNKVLVEKDSTKKLRSFTRKRISGKSKTKDVTVKHDNLKDLSLKDEESRMAGSDNSKAEKSVAEKSELGNGVEGVTGETVVKKNTAEEKENVKNVKTPMKRKRGADGEIVRAFISSPEQGSSRLRLRKEVPAFRMIELSENDSERIIGKRLKVYWSGSRKWFLGRIKAFDNEKRLHKIYYDDGDKEELDLRQERFELEVMPGDNFTLKTESKSEKKVKGSDGGNISAEVLKEDSIKEGIAELVKKHSGPKKKKAAKKALKRGSSKSKRRKDVDDKKAEDLIRKLDVDVFPENVDKVQIDEVQEVEEPSDAGAGKDHDVSKSISEKATGMNEQSVAQPTRLASISKNEEIGSDDGEESRKTVKDNSMKGGDAEPGKGHVTVKKKAIPGAVKVSSSRLQSRKESKEEEKLAANMEVDVHDDEVKTNTLHVEINLEESLDLDYPKENDQIESLEKEVSPKDVGMSLDARAGLPNFNSDKKEVGFEDSRVSGENDAGECSMLQGVKDNMEDLAADIEVAVNAEKAEAKVISGDVNVEGPGDVNSVKNNDETKSSSQAVSEGTCEVSPDMQPANPKSEEDSEILQEELKSKNSKSAEDRPKEELKKEIISEGMMKISTQGPEQRDDNHCGNDLNLVDLASQKNPVRRARSKVQKKHKS